jgi:hypothetical protein
MTKIKQVDVNSSVMWNKENGRTSPADQTEYAAAKKNTKTLTCLNCKTKIERSNLVFGEIVKCGKCGSFMKEVSS